jgi:hypothetical protein
MPRRKPKASTSKVVKLRPYTGYSSDDPIKAYEQWERMTNLLRVVRKRCGGCTSDERKQNRE